MAEEIKGQAVQVEETAGAETGEAEAPQDYNSLYHQEVKNSKKQSI